MSGSQNRESSHRAEAEISESVESARPRGERENREGTDASLPMVLSTGDTSHVVRLHQCLERSDTADVES